MSPSSGAAQGLVALYRRTSAATAVHLTGQPNADDGVNSNRLWREDRVKMLLDWCRLEQPLAASVISVRRLSFVAPSVHFPPQGLILDGKGDEVPELLRTCRLPRRADGGCTLLSRRSCIDVDMPAHCCRPVVRRKPARKAALVFDGCVLIADVHKNEKCPRTGAGVIRSSVDGPSRECLLRRDVDVAQVLFRQRFHSALRLQLGDRLVQALL